MDQLRPSAGVHDDDEPRRGDVGVDVHACDVLRRRHRRADRFPHRHKPDVRQSIRQRLQYDRPDLRRSEGPARVRQCYLHLVRVLQGANHDVRQSSEFHSVWHQHDLRPSEGPARVLQFYLHPKRVLHSTDHVR